MGPEPEATVNKMGPPPTNPEIMINKVWPPLGFGPEANVNKMVFPAPPNPEATTNKVWPPLGPEPEAKVNKMGSPSFPRGNDEQSVAPLGLRARSKR